MTSIPTPPDVANLLWLLAIVLWLAFLVAMASIAHAGGRLSWSGLRAGRGGHGGSQLTGAVLGVLITGTAGAITTILASFASF